MHPAHAKARTVTALVETAASVASLKARLDAIEAKLDELLAVARPADPEPARPPSKGR